MHLFHIFLYLNDMLLCKLYWHEMRTSTARSTLTRRILTVNTVVYRAISLVLHTIRVLKLHLLSLGIVMEDQAVTTTGGRCYVVFITH